MKIVTFKLVFYLFSVLLRVGISSPKLTSALTFVSRLLLISSLIWSINQGCLCNLCHFRLVSFSQQ